MPSCKPATFTMRPPAGADEIAVVRRHLAAYNERDLDALRALSHHDLEVDWSMSSGFDAGVYRGVDAVLSFYSSFFDAFKTIVLEPHELVPSADAILVPNVAHMRGRDEICVSARSTLAFTVRAGKVAKIRLCP
jgi:ketosteroid isomerase-like protein